ncbi:hypothetical protein ACFQV2_16545 [Actinokineospora soli]|uniref:Uncharacterized protein n=1 Tax=Actinokineospora soli TaxID=1048753 RepID=A0ABW2TQ26_9PSEU
MGEDEAVAGADARWGEVVEDLAGVLLELVEQVALGAAEVGALAGGVDEVDVAVDAAGDGGGEERTKSDRPSAAALTGRDAGGG